MRYTHFFLLFFTFYVARSEYSIYEHLNHFGDPGDQQSCILLEQTADQIGLEGHTLLLFYVPERFECCAQVFPYTYNDTTYMIVRVWKTLFTDLTNAEKRALFGHELMHIKNGDLYKKTPNIWLARRFFRIYALGMSLMYGTSFTHLSFNVPRAAKCMGGALIMETIFTELRYVYEFWKQRSREIRAELGAAYLLGSAQDAINLNNKIADRLSACNETGPIFIQKLSDFFHSFYLTHPSKDYLNHLLKKLLADKRYCMQYRQ